MPVDPNTPETTDRPRSRRRFKKGLTAVAVAGALLVPAAAVTVAAAPWADDSAVAASANSNGNGHEKGKGHMTAAEAEAELRECLDELNPSDGGELNPAELMKALRCLELVDSVKDPDAPVTEKEVEKLVKQGLQAVHAAGIDREQIPGVLSVLSDTGLAKNFAGERAGDLVTLMADSEIIESYANREIGRGEAAKQIAEIVVAGLKASAQAEAYGYGK